MPVRRRGELLLALLLALAAVLWALGVVGSHGGSKAVAQRNVVPTVKSAGPTHSAAIALSRDGKLVWSVNPADDSVSVIRTDRDTVVTKIKVGDEPQSVALDPAGRYAYVARPARARTGCRWSPAARSGSGPSGPAAPSAGGRA